MDHLILRVGCFAPRVGNNTEERLQALEAYLAALSCEWESLLAELDRVAIRQPTVSDNTNASV